MDTIENERESLKFSLTNVIPFKTAIEALKYKQRGSWMPLNIEAQPKGLKMSSSDSNEQITANWLIRKKFFESNEGTYEVISEFKNNHGSWESKASAWVKFSIEPELLIKVLEQMKSKSNAMVEFIYPYKDQKLQVRVKDKLGDTTIFNNNQYYIFDCFEPKSQFDSSGELGETSELASAKGKVKLFKKAFKHFANLKDISSVMIHYTSEAPWFQISSDSNINQSI